MIIATTTTAAIMIAGHIVLSSLRIYFRVPGMYLFAFLLRNVVRLLTVRTLTGASPKLIGNSRPILGRLLAFGGKAVNIFGILKICGMGAGGFNHLHQCVRIVQQRAGAKVVFIERLIRPVCFKQR